MYTYIPLLQLSILLKRFPLIAWQLYLYTGRSGKVKIDMPIAVTKSTMLSTEEILRTALAEHDQQDNGTVDYSEVISKAFVALDSPGNVSRDGRRVHCYHD